MSIGYIIANKIDANRVLLNALNEDRLVSIMCDGCEFGPGRVERLYVNVAHVGNAVVKYSAIMEITVHRKINFADRVSRYLQAEV